MAEVSFSPDGTCCHCTGHLHYSVCSASFWVWSGVTLPLCVLVWLLGALLGCCLLPSPLPMCLGFNTCKHLLEPPCVLGTPQSSCQIGFSKWSELVECIDYKRRLLDWLYIVCAGSSNDGDPDLEGLRDSGRPTWVPTGKLKKLGSNVSKGLWQPL